MAEKKKPDAPAAASPKKKRAPRKKAAKPIVAPEPGEAPGIAQPPQDDLQRLANVAHASPHAYLGAHPATVGGEAGAIVRTAIPNAQRAECVLADGRVYPFDRVAEGLSDVYQLFIPGLTPPFDYRVRFYYADGAVWERDDPYRFLPTLGEVDLHLFNEGNHREL